MFFYFQSICLHFVRSHDLIFQDLEREDDSEVFLFNLKQFANNPAIAQQFLNAERDDFNSADWNLVIKMNDGEAELGAGFLKIFQN